MTTFSVLYRRERFVIRGSRTTIGRAPWCDIPLGSAQASREHAQLVWTGEELSIVDLESLNGTMVNGDRITVPRTLVSGDVVVIGAELLLVMDDRAVARRVQVTEAASTPKLDEDTLEEGVVVTRTNRDQVELIELLVRGAERNDDRRDSAPALCRAIDNLAAYFGRSARRREDTAVARVRLRRLATDVASWFPEGDLDSWRVDLERRLDAVAGETIPPPPDD